MNGGFDAILYFLRNKGFLDKNSNGLVLRGGRRFYEFLKNNGYNVEYGTYRPKYDYIYIPRSKYSIQSVIGALTILQNRGIIISVVNELNLEEILTALSLSDYPVEFSIYTLSGNKFLLIFELKRSYYEG